MTIHNGLRFGQVQDVQRNLIKAVYLMQGVNPSGVTYQEPPRPYDGQQTAIMAYLDAAVSDTDFPAWLRNCDRHVNEPVDIFCGESDLPTTSLKAELTPKPASKTGDVSRRVMNNTRRLAADFLQRIYTLAAQYSAFPRPGIEGDEIDDLIHHKLTPALLPPEQP